ncbi:DEAD/DEAH box helicase [Tardiphaga sp. 862_B3_N4_1]|uniref:DEAD/DEAH box helicase n=1 Tax=Tardiphaga sp. 862_B3_N4_1 TaxID=3240764 RepID=UPI003F1ED050
MVDPNNILDPTNQRLLVDQMDDAIFQSGFGDTSAATDDTSLIELKLGAMLEFERWVTAVEMNNIIAAPASGGSLADEQASAVFDQWLAYVLAARGSRRIELHDLFLTTCTALWARRPTELRHVLGLAQISDVIARKEDGSWADRVRHAITRALILIARQSGRGDIASARDSVNDLRALQTTMDRAMLESTDRREQTALGLLALYHTAQVTIVLSDYVLTGQVVGDRGQALSVVTELQTLLRKALEYATLTSDPELVTWTNSVTLIASKLRSDSIFASGANINQKTDALIRAFSRDGAMFSMLPSQQEALSRNLLDPQREAIVLQMPTSSGKTLMAELAILQTLSGYADAKVIYVTPTRALSTQVRRTLGADFAELGVDVTAAGSAFEEDPFEQALLNKAAGVVVLTPEKLDLLLRAHTEWFEGIRLVIIDEAHLLKDGERGARLELLLANIRREHAHIRLLLLTPFIENAKEVASWLSEERGNEVDVKWRPSRLIVGIATIAGKGQDRNIEIEWREPHRPSELSKTLMVLSDAERITMRGNPSIAKRAITISRRLRPLGPSLVMFPSSRVRAEQAALEIANDKSEVDPKTAPAEFRVALALATNDYGENSDLVQCLRKGVAFHHSALSSELRYLVERLAAIGTLDFIAATTTLAQGMNFPVSSVVVHSVTKPNAGPLTPGEFWNIAGRAGRVGMSEKGVVVFASSNHRNHWLRYTQYLSEKVHSALAEAIQSVKEADQVKAIYRSNEGIRPFIQYIGHSVARIGAQQTSSDLERLVTASFAGRSEITRNALMRLARRYIAQVAQKQQSYMKVADQTGLASFSFDELYANIRSDPVLARGDATTLKRADGLKHLIDALAKLPELSLAIEYGHGTIDTQAVADVVHRWINGGTVQEISSLFVGSDDADRLRKAGRYVFGKVSQTVSWGAHAYIRGRDMQSSEAVDLNSEEHMLPAYIQYGVNTPSSVLASILGVPRQVASRIAEQYDAANGAMTPEDGAKFRSFLETSPVEVWRDAVIDTKIASIASPDDLRTVWRDAQGLNRRRPNAAPA